MKKKIGIGLLSLVVLVALIGAGGYWYLFGDVDEEIKNQVDQELGAISGQIQENIQAEKEQLSAEEIKGKVEEPAPEQPSDVETPTKPEEPTETKLEKGQLSEEAASVITSGTESLTTKTAGLVNIYYKGMKGLEIEGNSIVDQLLSNAKADYKRVTESGGKEELLSLAKAYSNQASAMESGMDASVEGLLAELKKDMLDEGAPKDDVDQIISQLRNEYKTKKKTRYTEIYAKFQKVLNVQ